MNGVVDKWFDGLLRQLVRPEHILLPITVKIHKERSQVTMEMQDLPMDDAVGAALTAFMSNTTMKNGGGSLRTTGFSLSSLLWKCPGWPELDHHIA